MHYRVLQTMVSNRETEDVYTYLGIKNGFEKIISSAVYCKSKIPIFIHIDGLQIYNNSQIQVWPITVKICHSKYICEPFVAGIYSGDSKPQNITDYLYDFVQDVKNLTSNGIKLHGKKYSLKLCGIIADAPARAFIKCCKPPNSFFACERGATKGVSVGKKRAIKRVYPMMNSTKRSKTSFLQRDQPEHHKDNIESSLLQLPNFDIINSVVIDSMHFLLHLGVMKILLEKWIGKKNIARLKRRQICHLKDVI